MLLKQSALLRRVVFDGYDYGLLFTYFTGIAEVLKRFRGRFVGEKEHPLYRAWRLSKEVVHEDVGGLFSALREADSGQTVDVGTLDAFVAALDAARAQADRSLFTAGLRIRLGQLSGAGGVLLHSLPYHPGVVAVARSMRGRWLKPIKSWRLQASIEVVRSNLLAELGLDEDQIELAPGELEIVEDGTAVVRSDRPTISVPAEEMPPSKAAAEEDGDSDVYLATVAPHGRSTLTDAEFEAVIDRYELYDFQQDGVRHLVMRTSALLADDMGLGKSRQATVAADIMAGAGQVLVVCPASLTINWAREIVAVVPDATVSVQAYDPQARWIVTNYERLDEMLPVAGRFGVMLVDEAHQLKEPTIVRTRLAFAVASQIPIRYLLTGTPILNRENEIHTLLRLSGHPVGDLPLKEFIEAFSGSREFRSRLRAELGDWMLRRRKDVLKGLQGKQRQVMHIELTEEQRLRYEALVQDTGTSSLVRITRARSMLEEFKTEAVLELLEAMQPEDKAIVFCEFTGTVAALAQTLRDRGIECVTLIGSDSTRRRQKAVDRFQSDPAVRVFIGTTSAAGVGITLTAGNHVVFASLPWTPALQGQAEDRAFRNGQLRLVLVKVPLMVGTIDGRLWELLDHKREVANDLLDPDQAEQQTKAALAAALKAE